MTADATVMTNDALARFVWASRYQYRDAAGAAIDVTLDDSWQRVARTLSAAETSDIEHWRNIFYQEMAALRFIPGGRILAGAGADRDVTLFNCFVMGNIQDPTDSISESLRQSAITLQLGGGIGCDFSDLLPRGIKTGNRDPLTPGPVQAMRMWEGMCASLSLPKQKLHPRHCAMMATLRCDHPDIEDFIKTKNGSVHFSHINLSVLVTDAFMAAVERDEPWPLVFPVSRLPVGASNGEKNPAACQIFKIVPAKELWQKIMQANYDYAGPGVLFIDRINRLDNLWYRDTIHCSNPCGEAPLPAYGACNLGSINLTGFVQKPFSSEASLDMAGIKHTAMVATRMLDNVIDVSSYPLQEQQEQAQGARRIGLGITGLADTLTQLGLHYAEPRARAIAAGIMEAIRDSAYRTSIDLAREKGSFPFFNADLFLAGENIQRLPHDIRAGIADTGIRNSHLTSIAPAGSISLLAGNVSSGIEPLSGHRCQQRILCGNDGKEIHVQSTSASYQLWLATMGNEKELPAYFVTANEIAPAAHLAMVAALQNYVDFAISKTVNVAHDIPFTEFRSIFDNAFKLGLKGCSIFRHGAAQRAAISGDCVNR